MARQSLAGRNPPMTHRRLPVGSAGGQDDLAEDEVDDAVEEVVLVGHVVVQRHRLDPEGFTELAHAERPDPALVGEGDGGAQHPMTAQWDPGLWRRRGRRRHLHSLLWL